MRYGDAGARTNMNKWEWFMSADINGSWIVTQGKANLSFSDMTFVGELVYEDSEGQLLNVYARIEGAFTEEGFLTVSVKNAAYPTYELSGRLYELADEREVANTFVVTDGTTVLGLTSRDSV